MSDRHILLCVAFLRAPATGTVGVLLGIHLARVGLGPRAIDLVVGAGLAGAALVVTLWGDRRGRREWLLAITVLGAAGGAALALASTPVVIGAAAFVGMVNGMGRDRGAALVVEQAMLPATTNDAKRTQTFALYNVLQDAGHALGGLTAGLPALLRHTGAFGDLAAQRCTLGLYALLSLAPALAYLRLPARTGCRSP